MPFFGARRSSDHPLRPGRRWLLRVLACGAAAVALVALAVLVALHSLDRPWLKGRLQSLVRTSAGVDIDYAAVQVSLLSGIDIDGIVVRSPLEVRPFAPDLVRVGRVSARWRPGLLLRRAPSIESLTITHVSLTVVVDEHGRTSFDALSPPGPSPAPGAAVPLSHRASSLFGSAAPPVGRVVVDDVTLALVQTEKGEVVERSELQGLAVTLVAMPGAPASGWRARLGLGSPTAPLDLALTRARVPSRGPEDAPTARARLWASVDGMSSAVTVALDLRMIDQTFAPSVSANHWLHAEADVRFDATAGRTVLTLDRTEAGDGAASGEAALEIPDAEDPIVRRARGDVDVVRLLHWLPAGLVPVTAEGARVHYQVDSLVAGPVLHLSEGGSATVDCDLKKVEYRAPGGPISVESGKLSLRAHPAEGGGVAAGGMIQLGGLRLTSGEDRLAADHLDLSFDGHQDAAGAVTARAGVRVGHVAIDGASPVAVSNGHVELGVQGVRLHADDPLATQGDVTVSLDARTLDARLAAAHLSANDVVLHAHTLLEGHPPYSLEVQAAVSRLRALGRDGVLLTDAPARAKVLLSGAVFDAARPGASLGIVHAAADLGEVKTTLDVTKARDAVDFAFDGAAPGLKAVRPFLTPALAKEAPWDQIGVVVRSSGRVEQLGGDAPSIQQTTELSVDRPSFGRIGARSASLKLRSKGNAFKHEGDLDLRARALTFDGGAASDDHLSLSAALDRGARSLRLHVDTEGRVAAKASASVSFDPARRAIPYEIEAHLAGLAPLSPFLANVHGLDGFDLSQLELGFSSHGTILGVVADVGRDGTVRVEPNPSRTAGVDGSAEVHVTHLNWTQGNNGVITPALAWRGNLRTAGERRTLESHLEIGALHLDLGPKDVDLTGVRDDSSVVLSGDLADPQTELSMHTAIHAVEQDLVPEYPVGDFTFALAAERGKDGLVHISDLKLANGAGGTTLGLQGNLMLGAGRRTLSITTALEQDLARLSRAPERFTGRGTVALEATVVSPDLTLLRVGAAVKAREVSVTMPRAGIVVEKANGDVPVTVTLELGKDGIALKRDDNRSPYSMLRFADQHPLLSRSGFLSIASIKSPFVSIAPLVGNLEIEQRVVSLRQFEMGIRGGSITGQCGLDWDGPRSTLELHVRATGVQSSHGEPFDGNIAVVIAAGDRTVEGRAEILRIGERHLLDLLDMQDPTHVDPAMNRIRSALLFGYPDKVRLVFEHGFASARLELGGLAQLVSISELRGIPMGPIVDKMLAKIQNASADDSDDTSDTKGQP